MVVVGGGAAGLAAAVAAARAGARTALVERYGFLGGMATAGMVSTICGLYLDLGRGPAGAAQRGIRRALRAPAGRDARLRQPAPPGADVRAALHAVRLRLSRRRAHRRRPGLDVYLHAYPGRARDRPRAAIDAVRVATWERTIELAARAVVDASGDAAVAHQAGAATETTRAGRPPAARRWSSCSSRSTPRRSDPGPALALLRALVTAEQEGRLPEGRLEPRLGAVAPARRGDLQARAERHRRGAVRAAATS